MLHLSVSLVLIFEVLLMAMVLLFLGETIFLYLQVRAELKNRWQVFVFNHLEGHNCFACMNPKYLWKKSWKGIRHPSDHSDSYEERSHAPTQTQLTHVTIQSGAELSCGQCPGLKFYTRKSLSSSDGDMTLGETMEEILESSQF